MGLLMMGRNSFRFMVPSSHKGTAEKEAHRNLHLLLAGKQTVSFSGGKEGLVRTHHKIRRS